MLRKIKNISFFISFVIFFFLILENYFSEKNITTINKNRNNYAVSLLENASKIPLLTNDTNNAIIYKNDIEEFKEKRKKYFWEKLLSNDKK